MKNTYFVQWINGNGVKQEPVLANRSRSFEQAAAWAAKWDVPNWATSKTKFIIWQGRPGPTTEYLRFTLGNVQW
ncbi:MAG: hypothetical protein H6658_05855 [Ardenticatenaceae bacterium]|nr:hypothetical protein [Ardenticatenaceae bacterium]